MRSYPTANAEPEILSRGEPAAADRNAFAGSWPFRFLGEAAEPAVVEKELRAAGIGSAWISPLDALFNAEPFSANDWLIRKASDHPLLQVVPVFNPRLTGAGADLANLLKEHPEIPAIRLTPGYHGYEANAPEVRDFVKNIPPGKTVLITLRVQDRRGQPPLFQVPDVPLDSAFALAEAFPRQTFLLCGIRVGEVTSAREKWRRYPNLHIETSFIDNISGIADCAEAVGDNHLHLGTLAPLLYASASVEKIRTSGLGRDRIRSILTNTLGRTVG